MLIPNHETRIYDGIVLERMKHLPKGGKMGDLPEHLQHESFIRTGSKKTGGPNMRLFRLEDDKPSLTITAYIFNKFVHPTENRYITPREAAVLQDFPIDYYFQGTLGQVQKQIGNAVPVKLAKAVADAVKRYFLHHEKRGCLNIASYFTGAGGLDLGFEQSSDAQIQFHTRFSSDIEHSAGATIHYNRPEWNFHQADITNLAPSIVMDALGGRPDILIGGPPCQPFSTAGKQRATADPMGNLYRDYIRHVSALQPDMVVMENVYGLAQVKGGGILKDIFQSFESIGYHVCYQELLAADYGTPQKRRRLFFIAAKNLDGFAFPEPTHSAVENILGLPLYEGAGNALKQLPKATVRL